MEPNKPQQGKPAITPITSRRGLGRGLDALIPSKQPLEGGDQVLQIAVTSISPNPYQPRRRFHPDRLRELADSIKLHGVMQPIVVRKDGERYMLIAGERRWRASTMAGFPNVPAIVRNVPNHQVLELTLIENIQREDLNPIETAEAFAQLSSQAGMTHEQIAERTGKDRVTVTNSLRLLMLPEEVQGRVAAGEISSGHAKALLSLESEAAQKTVAARIVAQGLSVRQTEQIVKHGVSSPSTIRTASGKTSAEQAEDPNVRAAVMEMERALGTRVRMQGNDRRGKIMIEYNTTDDLERIYTWIVGRQQ